MKPSYNCLLCLVLCACVPVLIQFLISILQSQTKSTPRQHPRNTRVAGRLATGRQPTGHGHGHGHDLGLGTWPVARRRRRGSGGGGIRIEFSDSDAAIYIQFWLIYAHVSDDRAIWTETEQEEGGGRFTAIRNPQWPYVWQINKCC
jgi:hypothetical protein